MRGSLGLHGGCWTRWSRAHRRGSSRAGLTCSLPPQKGPSSGKDRVKKGGSYMCHKVSQVTALCRGSGSGLWVHGAQ